MFKNLPCNARDAGKNAALGIKVLHILGQPSLSALEPLLNNKTGSCAWTTEKYRTKVSKLHQRSRAVNIKMMRIIIIWKIKIWNFKNNRVRLILILEESQSLPREPHWNWTKKRKGNSNENKLVLTNSARINRYSQTHK